jgi:TRAP transporter 4TM/12TM fusion protein
MSHYWLSTEGVFGVALGVSTGMVFMFVLFGSLLESAGAGNYFIRTAYAGLGHMRGGPAKAAVVSSGLTGLVSGSSIANVVTTGTFTIPLMKKVGFPAEKAGAVEVAASTNGQLTPPVMGAAAFLMVEYVGISYVEVIKHAFLPAIISYIALVYIVHLEACKMGLKGMEKPVTRTVAGKLLSFVLTVLTLIIIGGATYYGIGWIKVVAGDAAVYLVGVLIIAAYLVLLWLLPIVVLMWCLTVERLSPSLSAYYATVVLIFIVLTQRPLKGIIRKNSAPEFAFKMGWDNLIAGMVAGARNMIGIGVATAAAGIVVGTVTLTGIGLVMTAFVEFISGGNLLLILLFTAIISLLLGMGLPTTANYIVVSTLMAPVIVHLGALNGLVVPLVAVHLFVFYFGILADDTPPVGLAAFAAAGISGGDPIRTGIQGFGYDIRTAVLPFFFIFNNELLMIGIRDWLHLTIVIVSAVAAMLVFAAATQGYWLTKSRFYESLALLLVTFTLLRPGFFWDKVYEPYHEEPGTYLMEAMEKQDENTMIRLVIKGETLNGEEYTKALMLPVGKEGPPEERLREVGFEVIEQDGKTIVDNIMFGSNAERMGIDFDQEILTVMVESDRPPKQLMFIPALALLGLIYFLQKRRQTPEEASRIKLE